MILSSKLFCLHNTTERETSRGTIKWKRINLLYENCTVKWICKLFLTNLFKMQRMNLGGAEKREWKIFSALDTHSRRSTSKKSWNFHNFLLYVRNFLLLHDHHLSIEKLIVWKISLSKTFLLILKCLKREKMKKSFDSRTWRWMTKMSQKWSLVWLMQRTIKCLVYLPHCVVFSVVNYLGWYCNFSYMHLSTNTKSESGIWEKSIVAEKFHVKCISSLASTDKLSYSKDLKNFWRNTMMSTIPILSREVHWFPDITQWFIGNYFIGIL